MSLRYPVLGFVVMALLAGCGSSSSGAGAGAPPSAVTVTTPPPTPHHTHSPASAPTPAGSSAGPAVTRCLSEHLGLSLGIAQGTAGTTYQTVVLTNHGSVACTLFGYPGVSFDTAGGALIGKPSSEDPGKEKTITLPAAGGQANALLRQPDPGNFPVADCHKTTANKLRVYPPGETVPLFVHDAVQVCTTAKGRTGIGPMLAGNGG